MSAVYLVKYLIEDDEDEDFIVKEFAQAEYVVKWIDTERLNLPQWWSDAGSWNPDENAAMRYSKDEADTLAEKFKSNMPNERRIQIVVEPAPFDDSSTGAYAVTWSNSDRKTFWWMKGGWTHRRRQAKRFTKEEAEYFVAGFQGDPNVKAVPLSTDYR